MSGCRWMGTCSSSGPSHVEEHHIGASKQAKSHRQARPPLANCAEGAPRACRRLRLHRKISARRSALHAPSSSKARVSVAPGEWDVACSEDAPLRTAKDRGSWQGVLLAFWDSLVLAGRGVWIDRGVFPSPQAILSLLVRDLSPNQAAGNYTWMRAATAAGSTPTVSMHKFFAPNSGLAGSQLSSRANGRLVLQNPAAVCERPPAISPVARVDTDEMGIADSPTPTKDRK